MSVDGIIFLQHWATLIQPINHAVFCTFFKAICISYHHSYNLIASGNRKVCIWLSVFAIFNYICKECVIVLWLWLKSNYAKFFACLLYTSDAADD